MSYAYNGNVTAAVDSENGSWSYTYDAVNREEGCQVPFFFNTKRRDE
jgi:hypothetical protein